MRFTAVLAGACALTWAAAASASGPSAAPAALSPGQASALQRACVAAGARAFESPPASVWVYDPDPAGGIGLWVGGGQFVCRYHGSDRVILTPTPSI